MEATINEVLQDVAESEPGDLKERCKGISEPAAATLRALWGTPEHGGGLEKAHILDKFQVSLTASQVPPFDLGQQPYQRAKKLVQLRNALVHYKPDTQSSDDEYAHKMEKALKGEFPSNKIFVEPFSPWYTIGCLGYGCSEWAHTSATAFVDEWQTRIGIVRDYKDEMREYETP
ncbi:hypothetical protein ACLTEW_18465 [Gordonia lacunae]|uniref:hypothetical protein n=1 Tax=Gordonia lacunae TaxID=417102 RepID=UPI0039E3B54A